MKANCVVCGEAVELYAQSDHLRFKHPAPHKEGFRFWHDARVFFSQRPSMTVGELVALIDAPPTYCFYMEVDVPGQIGKELAALSHGNAVDLTQEPHFYSIPPARM